MGLAWVLLVGLTAGEEGVKFYDGSWENALKEAAKGGKLVFADFYTDW